MNTTRLLASACALAIAPVCLLTPAIAAENEGVALAIVYDTSGSMKETVPGAGGNAIPKYIIANRALVTLTKQIQAFVTNAPSGENRNVQAGLFVFEGSGAREVISLGPFDATAFQNWAKGFSRPQGNTPLGNSLQAAAERVNGSPLPRKHVLIITDGMNTAGPDPATVLKRLKASFKEATPNVHFVAFDVDAKVFEPVKRLGATVVPAANEQQLNTQLDFILQKKILLEEEEPRR
jgi:hypothetical protein